MSRFATHAVLSALILLSLTGMAIAEWLLNPGQWSDYPIAAITPDEQVIVFYDIMTEYQDITPWMLSYQLVDEEPQILFNQTYADSIQAFGTPAIVKTVSDRCYVLTLHGLPERHWQMYAVNFNGETLWHRILTSESDPDYTEGMQDYGMTASEAGCILIWNDYSSRQSWTGRWFDPDGDEVRPIGPYPNPNYNVVFALAEQGDHFLLCHEGTVHIIGQASDSSVNCDIGHQFVSSHQVDTNLFLLEYAMHDFTRVRCFNLDDFETNWVDTLVTDDEDEWCISGYWSDRSLVFNSWEECYYQRFNDEGITGDAIHFYNSLSNTQIVVPFGEDDADWIFQRDSLNGHSCDIFLGFEDSVVFLDNAGINSGRRSHVLSDSERLHLIWQDYDGIRMKLLPDELESITAVSFHLEQTITAYPNPFNNSCRLQLYVAQPAQVELTVHDLLGRQIAQWQQSLPPGTRTIDWQPERLSAGLYFISLRRSQSPPEHVKVLYLP